MTKFNSPLMFEGIDIQCINFTMLCFMYVKMYNDYTKEIHVCIQYYNI